MLVCLIMEDHVDTTNDPKRMQIELKMGADNNSSATSRLTALQARKQTLEEKLATKNKELRNLCIQEAELTGIMPAEIPLEPGETLPTVRRRIGTAFEYSQTIIANSNTEMHDETVPALETKIQVQRKIAEAALQLASNATMSKSIKRKNMSLYRQTKQQLTFLEEKLDNVKLQQTQTQQQQQLKQKKKPRPPLESDNVSNKSNISGENDEMNDAGSGCGGDQDPERFVYATNKHFQYKNTNSFILNSELYNNVNNVQNYNIPEDEFGINANKLTGNNFIGIREKRNSESSCGNNNNNAYIPPHTNTNIYHQQQQQLLPQKILYNTRTLPHVSPKQQQQQYQTSSVINVPAAHTLNRLRYPSDDTSRKYAYSQPDSYSYYAPSHFVPGMNYKTNYVETNPMLMHMHYNNMYETCVDGVVSTPTSSGLGGYWAKTEKGDTIWCPTGTVQMHEDMSHVWQTEQRFGSLDRRKARHLHNKRTSPGLESVKQTTSTVRSPQELQRPTTLQPIPSGTSVRMSKHDSRKQLVRTQSLGSVGAQTLDSVWPSDDNSSYDDSDGHSLNELNGLIRKPKQKGWYETSLDGPVVPQLLPTTTTTIVPEETSLPIPLPPKPILEIPAESNPSPKHQQAQHQIETNIEIYNNNALNDLPKNCTVVQAGHCKPYREVTKPFEMSDFYKYSTKYRERNSSTSADNKIIANETVQTNQCDVVDDVLQKGVYQPLQPMKCQPFSPTGNLNQSFASVTSPYSENTTLDSSLALNMSDVAECFSAEMNAWYQNHQPVFNQNNNNGNNNNNNNSNNNNNNNNNNNTSPLAAVGRSPATLV